MSKGNTLYLGIFISFPSLFVLNENKFRSKIDNKQENINKYQEKFPQAKQITFILHKRFQLNGSHMFLYGHLNAWNLKKYLLCDTKVGRTRITSILGSLNSFLSFSFIGFNFCVVHFLLDQKTPKILLRMRSLAFLWMSVSCLVFFLFVLLKI